MTCFCALLFCVAAPPITPECTEPAQLTPLNIGLLVIATVAVIALVVGLTTVSAAICFILKKKQKQSVMAKGEEHMNCTVDALVRSVWQGKAVIVV